MKAIVTGSVIHVVLFVLFYALLVYGMMLIITGDIRAAGAIMLTILVRIELALMQFREKS